MAHLSYTERVDTCDPKNFTQATFLSSIFECYWVNAHEMQWNHAYHSHQGRCWQQDPLQ